MYRNFRLAVLTAIAFFTLAAIPPMLPESTALSLSGSAYAQKPPTTNAINLNSSRSNIYRTKQPTKKPASARATTVKSSKSNTSD